MDSDPCGSVPSLCGQVDKPKDLFQALLVSLGTQNLPAVSNRITDTLSGVASLLGLNSWVNISYF